MNFCPFCGLSKRKLSDIKKHISDKGGKCYYWSVWIFDKKE